MSVVGVWARIPGVLKQIDTGYTRAIWGVNRAGKVWKLRSNMRSWKLIGGRLIHVSAGEGGVWGVSRKHTIWYRLGKSFFSFSFYIFEIPSRRTLCERSFRTDN